MSDIIINVSDFIGMKLDQQFNELQKLIKLKEKAILDLEIEISIQNKELFELKQELEQVEEKIIKGIIAHKDT